VPLNVNEERSADMRALLTSDPDQIVWWGTQTECTRRCRARPEKASSPLGEAWARVVLFYLIQSWSEVQPSGRLRAQAEGFLDAQPLKAADALHLAAAFVWCSGQTRDREFVCLDRQLRNAAGNVGFTVIPYGPVTLARG
jgi:predicted nucleic acid-binding protein